MKLNRRILLYGNSVILGSIGASLRRCPQFEVAIQAPQPNETKELLKKNPDVLLFDLEAPHAETVFSLLKADPTLLVIGVSPGINLVDIWSGRRLRGLSLQGLLELIGKTENGSPVELIGNGNHPDQRGLTNGAVLRETKITKEAEKAKNTYAGGRNLIQST